MCVLRGAMLHRLLTRSLTISGHRVSAYTVQIDNNLTSVHSIVPGELCCRSTALFIGSLRTVRCCYCSAPHSSLPAQFGVVNKRHSTTRTQSRLIVNVEHWRWRWTEGQRCDGLAIFGKAIFRRKNTPGINYSKNYVTEIFTTKQAQNNDFIPPVYCGLQHFEYAALSDGSRTGKSLFARF